jgi:hypothetical protein
MLTASIIRTWVPSWWRSKYTWDVGEFLRQYMAKHPRRQPIFIKDNILAYLLLLVLYYATLGNVPDQKLVRVPHRYWCMVCISLSLFLALFAPTLHFAPQLARRFETHCPRSNCRWQHYVIKSTFIFYFKEYFYWPRNLATEQTCVRLMLR